jgi:nucleoside-diphosphate kinase
MVERTLVIVKPDAVQRGLIGSIVERFEKKTLKVVGMKMLQLQDAILREHYAHVVDRPFFDELNGFMQSSPVVVLCLEGLHAVEVVRKISGTDPFVFGTIRGDFTVSSQRKIVHSSDSFDAAQREIERFFLPEELFDYDKDEWKHVLSESDVNPSL